MNQESMKEFYRQAHSMLKVYSGNVASIIEAKKKILSKLSLYIPQISDEERRKMTGEEVNQRIDAVLKQMPGSADFVKEEISKLDQRRRDANYKFENDFITHLDRLPAAFDEWQKPLDIADSTLQAAIQIAKLGKKVERSTIEKTLQPFYTYPDWYHIVYNSFEANGAGGEITADFISKENKLRGLFPYDVNEKMDEYRILAEKATGEFGDSFFLCVRDLEMQLITDAAAFGVLLDTIATDAQLEVARDEMARRVMGLPEKDPNKILSNLLFK